MKRIGIILLSVIVISVIGYSLFERGDMESYDVDDYKIIEIYYGRSIDQELMAQFEETDEKVLEILDDAAGDPGFKTNAMCLIIPDSGGYRILNTTNGRYLEDGNEPISIYNDKLDRGVFDGENTFCSNVKYEEEHPGDKDAVLAYELADILMSETRSEITEEKDLIKYTELLTGEKTDSLVNHNGDRTAGIHSIKIMDFGETRLIRIYDVWEDNDGLPYYVDRVGFIQITLSNDTEKFEELYDEIYNDIMSDRSS